MPSSREAGWTSRWLYTVTVGRDGDSSKSPWTTGEPSRGRRTSGRPPNERMVATARQQARGVDACLILGREGPEVAADVVHGPGHVGCVVGPEREEELEVRGHRLRLSLLQDPASPRDLVRLHRHHAQVHAVVLV